MIFKIAACDIDFGFRKKLFDGLWLGIRTEFLIIAEWSLIPPFLYYTFI